MKKIILALLAIIPLSACGTVRYRVTAPTDGQRVSTAVQWDVVELKFNNLWKELLIPEYFK